MRRQELLQEVLNFVISDDYYVEQDWIVFGWEAYLREHSPSLLTDRTPHEKAQDEVRQETARLKALFGTRYAVSREGLTPFHGPTAEKIWRELRNEYPRAFQQGTELHYALASVSRLSDCANRSLRLDETAARSLPAPEVDHFIREATTCYLYGLFDAATIVCRSVLQKALEIRIRREYPQLPLAEVLRKEQWLDSLISFAAENHLFAEKDDAGTARHLDALTKKLDAHVDSDSCYGILGATRKVVAGLC